MLKKLVTQNFVPFNCKFHLVLYKLCFSYACIQMGKATKIVTLNLDESLLQLSSMDSIAKLQGVAFCENGRVETQQFSRVHAGSYSRHTPVSCQSGVSELHPCHCQLFHHSGLSAHTHVLFSSASKLNCIIDAADNIRSQIEFCTDLVYSQQAYRFRP